MSPTGVQLQHSQVRVSESALHVVEAGDPDATPVLFLHDWPQSWRAWLDVTDLAGHDAHAIAVDLPDVARSSTDPTDGSKRRLADVVQGLVAALGLHGTTLAGRDIGGGFNWYRAFARDAADNHDAGTQVDTPLAYARGENEPGDINAYVDGPRKAGLTDTTPAVIPGAGHFTPEEAPAELWQMLARFANPLTKAHVWSVPPVSTPPPAWASGPVRGPTLRPRPMRTTADEGG